MGDRTQWRILEAERAQLSQLEELNARHRQQQDAQHQQAILADVSFQTERRAKQLSALAAQDPLVAAMFAEEWLGSVHDVTTEHFDQIEHKRSWHAAVSRLEALTRPIADPAARAMVQQVRAVHAEAEQLYRALGNAPNPDAQIAALRQQRAAALQQSARAGKLGLGLAGAGCVVPTVLFVGSAIMAAILQLGVDGTCGVSLSMLAFLVLGVAGAYQIASWSDGKKKAQLAEGDLRRFQYALGQLQALSADPNRGGLLSRFYAEHPALSRTLPNVDDAALLSAGIGAPSHVVERQKAVARCRYCKALTPVYAAICQSCGAQGFA